ncbi:MAG TPA: M48 family metallopeptidase [Acidobacteriota bacterium]
MSPEGDEGRQAATRSRRALLALLVAAIVGSGLLVAAGSGDERVGLGSLSELWADLVWDADSAALNLTRVPDAEENRLGAELAGPLAAHTSDAAGEVDGPARLERIGRRLVAGVERPAIDYRFYVIPSASVNAMALPGGHVAVTSAMLEFAATDDELAVVLGHEIAHVDRRHCIERYQHVLTLQKAGIGSLGFAFEMLRRLAAQGYRQYQEIEADAEGLRLAREAGYDAAVGGPLLERLATLRGEPVPPPASGPIDETLDSLGRLIGSYGRSHPPSRERAARLRASASRRQGR